MYVVILSFGITFLILELIIPEVIYLNLALASFITACASLFTSNTIALSLIFAFSLTASILVVRPRIIKYQKQKNMLKKMKAQYIGKIAQVVEQINKNSGILSINDERWQARTTKDETIEQGQNAKIMDYKDIIMYVEKV